MKLHRIALFERQRFFSEFVLECDLSDVTPTLIFTPLGVFPNIHKCIYECSFSLCDYFRWLNNMFTNLARHYKLTVCKVRPECCELFIQTILERKNFCHIDYHEASQGVQETSID